MPSEWRETSFGDLMDIPTRNGIHKGPPFQGHGVPVVKMGEVYHTDVVCDAQRDLLDLTPQELDRLEVVKDDLLFCRTSLVAAGVGHCAIVGELSRRTTFASNLIRVRLDSESTAPRYWFYHFRSPAGQEQLLSIARGTSVTTITGPDIAALRVAAPDVARQRTIARILGALDDKIELNRKMNETLAQMARAIFKSWFVDFEPFRDKGMTDSPLGGIPKGWKAGTVADVAKFNAWTLRDTDDLDRIEYIEISEVTRGDVVNVQVFSRGTEPSRARRRLRHGDTVLSTVRPERKSYFLCLNPPTSLIASTGFAVFSPTAAPWSFVHAALTRPDVFEHLGTQADGGAYPSVHAEVIAALPIPLPPAPILDGFQRICAPLYQKAAYNRIESRTLAAIRDALLPKLMSGEVKIR
ncbi:MAG TPA: restriction endonuclease subunit S [bacterium]|nr:restriction endonuclease subunit S [bacterium]